MNRLEWATLMDFADLPGHADFSWMKALKMNNAAVWTIKKKEKEKRKKKKVDQYDAVCSDVQRESCVGSRAQSSQSFLFNPRVGQNIAFNASPVARNSIPVLQSTPPWLICCWHAYFKKPPASKKCRCKNCAEIIPREIPLSLIHI